MLVAAVVPVSNVRTAEVTRSAGLSEGVMLRLERAAWIEAGEETSTAIVYVFVDMECPYCRTLYSRIAAAKPRVRVRYLPVAVLQPSSWERAAAVLQAADPRSAFDSLERGLRTSPRTVEVRPETEQTLRLNNVFMDALGLPATPGIVYRDSDGSIRATAGLPDDALLARIFRLEKP